ncbi:LysR family transcriptional regulator [Novosphingobium profundi]|uniref:LysR family transcriptional regulator n=1 Tax=Novosphingobium profundi TaxID=1774954 RepID=UPI001BDA21F9|nr:LysR family transcriptional regulator [Novosphingobium profundi]MBT0669264.1 LysR family transcriptional regulator [Novosphingobium profundi]
MDLRRLKHFLAVAELGNFSRAAERVCLTQSALTRSVRSLEDELGATLFERRAQGAELTQAGSVLMDHAHRLLNEFERAQQNIALVKHGVGEQVVLGVCPFLPKGPLQELCGAFSRNNPEIALNLVEGFVDETIPALMNRKLDFVFTSVPTPVLAEKVTFERLGKLPSSVFAAPDHPLARLRKVTIRELSTHSWVSLGQAYSQVALRSFFGQANCGIPSNCVTTNSMAFMSSLINEQGMLGILPDALIADSGPVKVDVASQPKAIRAGLVFRPGSKIKPSVRRLAEGLREKYAFLAEA